MDDPAHQLTRLLEKHDLSAEMFHKRGRPPRGVREKRAAVVTELHAAGTPWTEMVAITGLSLMSIQRLTGATWNEKSRRNRQESASRTGSARKGEVKPWLSQQLQIAWSSGAFDFHRGRAHNDAERAKMRASYTLEVRARLSRLRVSYLLRHSGRVFRGRASTLSVRKFPGHETVTVRSSYEARAVALLEADIDVISYEYEPRLVVSGGRQILPDFLVSRKGGVTLIEVKPAWVLRYFKENDRPILRLRLAEKEAQCRGWAFNIWTEKDLFNA